jgi:hypothetical protein
MIEHPEAFLAEAIGPKIGEQPPCRNNIFLSSRDAEAMVSGADSANESSEESSRAFNPRRGRVPNQLREQRDVQGSDHDAVFGGVTEFGSKKPTGHGYRQHFPIKCYMRICEDDAVSYSGI